MSVYRNISEALGIAWEPSGHLDEDVDVYDHKMCRVPGVPHDDISKALIAEKTREYWKTPEGQKKRQRLIEWNKKTKSEVMKRLQDERPEMFYRGGRPKGSKDFVKRKDAVRRKPRKVNAAGTIYDNIYEASYKTGLSVSGVKKRCQRNILGWSYISG